MQHVPEPDRSEWVARMRERARLDAEELLPSPPFAVFGLAEPRLPSAYLAEAGQVNGVWESISLAYGDGAEAAGPWVVVTTRTGPDDAGDREVEAELLRAIDHDRNRIDSQAGVYEDDLGVPPDYSRADLAVGGENLSGLAGRQENVWAARLVADGLIVTLVVRGVDPASVRLDPVADLAPYLQARNDRLGLLQRASPASAAAGVGASRRRGGLSRAGRGRAGIRRAAGPGAAGRPRAPAAGW